MLSTTRPFRRSCIRPTAHRPRVAATTVCSVHRWGFPSPIVGRPRPAAPWVYRPSPAAPASDDGGVLQTPIISPRTVLPAALARSSPTGDWRRCLDSILYRPVPRPTTTASVIRSSSGPGSMPVAPRPLCFLRLNAKLLIRLAALSPTGASQSLHSARLGLLPAPRSTGNSCPLWLVGARPAAVITNRVFSVPRRPAEFTWVARARFTPGRAGRPDQGSRRPDYQAAASSRRTRA